eukprot:GDKI01014062.1.p2 GENE.GDKI01014062.1~~GDKI01014062.1.p2  ORF type:complete len:113 (-),score=38.47 GDKI01014062.1:126-464(-)
MGTANMAPKVQKSKEQKAAAAAAGGRSKKKKWSKGKVREKMNNLVVFDKATYDKLVSEVPKSKLITPSVIAERLKVNGSLARQACRELRNKGLAKVVGEHHHAQYILTRPTA